MPFIEKSLNHLAYVIQTSFIQWESSSRDALFQKIDARIKVFALIYILLIISLNRNLPAQIFIGTLILILAVISRIDLMNVYKRVLFFSFVFGFVVALPSVLNIVTRGEVILPLITLSKPYTFLIYKLPDVIGITREGLHVLAMLTLRIMNSIAISLLVLYTTPFHDLIRALRILKIHETFLMIVMLTYKYIFVFAKTIENIHLAKKSRLAACTDSRHTRIWISGRIAFIFRKTMLQAEDVFRAMQSRGLSGDVKMPGLKKMNSIDWISGMIVLIAGLLILFI